MTTFTKRIAATADDIWNNDSNCRSDQTTTIFGSLTTGASSGYRFTNVTIPQGATISDAKLTFKSGGSSGTVNVRIYGVDQDNYAGFSCVAGNKPSDYATVTTAYENWTPAAWTDGSNYDSVDFADVVQEIVDRASWSSGNAMSVIVRNNGTTGTNYRAPVDYTSSSANAPLLTINYTTAAGPTNLKTYNTNAAANIKTINTNAIANVKSLNTNT